MGADLLVLVEHARPDVDARLGLVVPSVEPKAVAAGRVVDEALDLSSPTGHDLHEHVRPTVGYLEQDALEASTSGGSSRRRRSCSATSRRTWRISGSRRRWTRWCGCSAAGGCAPSPTAP